MRWTVTGSPRSTRPSRRSRSAFVDPAWSRTGRWPGPGRVPPDGAAPRPAAGYGARPRCPGRRVPAGRRPCSLRRRPEEPLDFAGGPVEPPRGRTILESDPGPGEIASHGVAGDPQPPRDLFDVNPLTGPLANPVHDIRLEHPMVLLHPWQGDLDPFGRTCPTCRLTKSTSFLSIARPRQMLR